MSEDERQEALKVMRAFNESSNSTLNSRGRGGRGRGNRTSQRQKSDKSEAEAEFADTALMLKLLAKCLFCQHVMMTTMKIWETDLLQRCYILLQMIRNRHQIIILVQKWKLLRWTLKSPKIHGLFSRPFGQSSR
jgi:hypothetical protein